MMAYSPDKISKIIALSDRRRIYMGSSPELSMVGKLYGVEVTESWLVSLLTYFGEFVGTKEKVETGTMHDLARIIIGMAWYLRMSEVMLFFADMMSGRYGKFYGAIDPLTITVGLRSFLSDRLRELAHYEYEAEKERKDKERLEAKQEAVSWEEYAQSTASNA